MPAAENATILLYHGVTATPPVGIENFSRKHLPVEEFDAQMALVRETCRPVSLRELADRVSSGEALPPNLVAVTFDDTFKNVHDVALPVLKKHGIPATFFISTGFIETDRRFWVDLVEHRINRCAGATIDLALGGTKRQFSLATRECRIAAVIEIKQAMKAMTPAERDLTLELLLKTTGVHDAGTEVSNYANLTWQDVRRLHEPPNYEVGGHTVNHEILAYLDDTRLNYEIGECKSQLEKGLSTSIDLFSYPEGQSRHFDDRVIARLKAFGIRICPSAMMGSNPPSTDPFRLRRCMVGFMEQRFPQWLPKLPYD